MQQVPHVFVISLARATQRRRRMVARLALQDLAFTLVNAADAAPGSDDGIEIDRYAADPGVTGQGRAVAACFASHLRALRAGLSSGEAEFLVVEDDVLLARDFKKRFLKLKENVPPDAPIVSLAYLVWRWNGFLWAGRDPSRENLVTMGDDLWGTQLYLITRSWAERCLDRLDRPLPEIDTTDLRTSELIVRSARSVGGLAAHPALGIEDLSGSGSLLVPAAGNQNHAEGQRWWNAADFDSLDDLAGASTGFRRQGGKALGLLRTLPILAKMRPVEGWLDDEEADLLIASTSHSVHLDETAAIVEIGSYCGRSTVVLAGTVQGLASKQTRVYAIDPHEGSAGAVDQDLTHGEPTLARFTRNLRAAGVEDLVEVIQKCSHEVVWEADLAIGFLFVDGLHDYENVARDFRHFEPYLRSGARIAFHDYADYYPGVLRFVDELLYSGRYRRLECAKSLIVVEAVEAPTAPKTEDPQEEKEKSLSVLTPGELHELRAAWDSEGIVTIENFLIPEDARKVSSFLEGLPDDQWSVSAHPYQPSTFTFANTPENQTTIEEAIKSAAAEHERGRFAYHFRRHEPTAGAPFDFSRLVVSAACLKIFGRVTGYDLKGSVSVFCSCYSAGCFLSTHTDTGRGKVAFVYNATREWDPKDGGCFELLSPDWSKVIKRVPPVYNSLTFFRVEGDGVPHRVSRVEAASPRRRFAISGWLG